MVGDVFEYCTCRSHKYWMYFLELNKNRLWIKKPSLAYLLSGDNVMFRNSLACTLCCENDDIFTEDNAITNVVCHDDMVIKLRFRHNQRWTCSNIQSVTTDV